MPGQQGSSTPASTGSESLRANAAEFVPKLRATATAFVPSGNYNVYGAPRMQQTFIPPIQRPAYYVPRQHRMDVPGLVQNPNMMNPMVAMGQGPYHFQHGFMAGPVAAQFHPGMAQVPMMPMQHESQPPSRRQTMSPVKAKAEQRKEAVPAAEPASESTDDNPAEAIDRETEDAVIEEATERVQEAAPAVQSSGGDLDYQSHDGELGEPQPESENDEAVAEKEVEAAPEAVSIQSVENESASVPEQSETEEPEANVIEAEASESEVKSVSAADAAEAAPSEEVSAANDLSSGGEPVTQADNTAMPTEAEAATEESSAEETSDKDERRYTVDEILEVHAQLQAEQEASRPPLVVIEPARYSVQDLMVFQPKFNDTPAFTNPSLDCIGSPTASRPHAGSAGGGRDRRPSVDRRGYHAGAQRERGARGYDKAKSRDASRSREISRANFGHLQGTIKPMDERESRRRQEREKDRFDGPVRAPEPQFEPLAMTENRYVVKKDVEGEELAIRQVQSVLNKLTPEKFDRLVTQLIELIMSHLDHLERIIGLVFDKAVNEFNFAHMYSDLCHCLHKRLAGLESEVGRFRVILLERCRLEFESRSQFAEKIAGITDEDERDTVTFLSRRRSRGLLTFIGHLFNRQLLHFQVINRCLAQLTPHTSLQCGRNIEWDIEDTCTLWTVMGKKFATLRYEDVQRVVDVSFQIIENVIETCEVSSRMIFMLKDLVDLRNNRWEPRREVVVASTLAEVHKKAAQEALAKERAAQKADRADRRKRDDRDPRFENRRSASVALGNTFGSGDGRSRLNTVDGWSQKISKSKRVAAPDQPIRASVSAKDLRSIPSSSRTAEVQETQPVVNAYSVLGQSEDDESQSPDITSEEIEGEESSFEASASDQDIPIDENAVRDKIKRMVEEFVSIEDYKEVMLAIEDLRCPSLHHLIVSEGLAMAAEGKPKDRELIPKMLLHIFNGGRLSTDQIVAGLSELLELLEDLEIDIPKIRVHFGEFIAKFILEKALPISYLSSVTSFKHIPLKTFQSIQSLDASALPDLIREENLDLHGVLSSSFEPKEGCGLSSFLSNNGLESLVQCLR